jgi:ATP-dependent HslUV protease ATP-binding subunit HslU
MEELTPRQIVAELDKYIVGQQAAKRAVAIALRNRHRRRLLADDLRDEVIPKNILMIGPTGVGKTEIARRLAHLARAPFIKVEATKFTEVGYVGRDVDSMVRDLAQASVRMVEREKMDEVREKADQRALERIVDILQPKPTKGRVEKVASQVTQQVESFADALNQLFKNNPSMSGYGATVKPYPPSPPEESETNAPPSPPSQEADDTERVERIRLRLREQIRSGARDEDSIEIEVEDTAAPPILQILGGPGGPMDDSGMDMQSALGSLMPKKRKRRTVTIKEAKEILAQEEAHNLIDHDQVVRDAIERTEQSGIIFVDEMDKIAGRSEAGGSRGPDVSREGVQRDILPIIEGSTVQTKYGPVRTDHVLFIAAGAFHVSKPSDLIPELQGRLPIRVELENLTEEDFRRILTEPRNALIKQYTALLATEGVALDFTEDGITEVARTAAQVNAQMENIGARRLHTILERLLDEVSFEAPEVKEKKVTIDAAYVRARLEAIVKDEDLSHYIL